MTRQDYLEALREDILDNYKEEILDEADFYDIYDKCELDDSVTGNASGFYCYVDLYDIEEAFDVVEEMIQDGCYEKTAFADAILNGYYDEIDVNIRCYLLQEALSQVYAELGASY